MNICEYPDTFHFLPLHSIQGGNCTCKTLNCSSPAKHPRPKNGVYAATSDPALIDKWKSLWPDGNMGLATGKISDIVVVDIDPRHGGLESIKRLEPIPDTVKVGTGGDGFHLYFKYPQIKVGNRVNWLAGIDVKSDGGYVVMPPSMHASGKRYTWLNHDWGKISEIPPHWLRSIVSQKKDQTQSQLSHLGEGSRNNFLASLAGFLSSKGMSDKKQIDKALQSFNLNFCSPPLQNTEVERIAASISKYKSEWNDPIPLLENKPKVPSMDEHYLPESIKPWIMDIVERMQVPIEFIAVPAVISLAAAIGRSASIFPKKYDNWQVTPNLWGALVARPGFFKSPCIAEAMKPLQYLATLEKKFYESQKEIYSLETEIIQAQIDGIMEVIRQRSKKSNNDDNSTLKTKLADLYLDLSKKKIVEKRYVTNDPTIEKLAGLMAHNPRGLLLLRDELFGWLKSLNKPGREGDREFYLECWNGSGSFTIDRVSRGTVHIDSLCLSVLGGFQPGKLSSYITNMKQGGAADDGLMQRFQLIVYPDLPEGWENIDRQPNEKACQKLTNLFNSIHKMRNTSPREYRFDDLALKEFVHWRTNLESRLRSGKINSLHFESHIAKYRSLIPSLALIFQVVNDLKSESVGLSSLNLATKWGCFLESHINKIYQLDCDQNITPGQVLATKIIQKQIHDETKVRLILRRSFAGINNTQKLDQACQYLEDLNWIKMIVKKTRGRSSTILQINPKIYLKQFHNSLLESLDLSNPKGTHQK